VLHIEYDLMIDEKSDPKLKSIFNFETILPSVFNRLIHSIN